MTKQVRETKAAQSIRAIVVLNKKGEHVATVQSHYADGGTVIVDVWNEGDATKRCFDTADKLGKVSQASRDDRAESEWRLFGLQQGRAGGGGYDKLAAALSGLMIDGHTMADHCGQVPEAEKARAKLLADYRKAFNAAGGLSPADDDVWQKKAAKLGCRFANWSTPEGWQSLHFIAGLDRLEALGYKIITAI